MGIFVGSIFLALFLFSSLLLFAQYRLVGDSVRISELWKERRKDTTAIRTFVARIDHESRIGHAPQNELRELGQYLNERKSSSESSEVRSYYSRFAQAFEREFLSGKDFKRFSPEDRRRLALKTDDFLSKYAQTIILIAKQEQQQQLVILRWACVFIALLILSGILVGRKFLEVITRPLEKLTSFVDQLDLEGALPDSVPVSRSAIPEVVAVARSFDRLLGRLRGYRALGIRRLLAEKKRAELIAESISDGICLLRGDEVIYANAMARKILSYGAGSTPSPLVSMDETVRRLRAEQPSGELAAASLGARAILNAISRTMPVEFSILEEGESDRHFLIHAGSIPVEVAVGAETVPKVENQLLIVAQDVTLVKESQEAKGHFLGTLSHEIKTPVTSLTMATRLLERIVRKAEKEGEVGTITTDSVSGLVRTCVEEVDRLRRLLDEFLSVSRLDTLTQKVESQMIDFIKLVRNSVQGFQGSAMDQGVSLSFKLRAEVRQLWLPVDPSKLTWALSNLLTNAIRHTPRGGRVEAELEVLPENVEVRVRDTGPGIEPKRRKNIFEKFSPYYDIRVARSGSTGAGLSIAREIITAHGGRIWVSEAAATGAEFCFTLPLQSKRMTQEKAKGEISGTSACSG